MLVGHEIDRSVNEEPQELRPIFIAMQQFDQHQEKKELGTVSQQKSPGKE